MKPEGMCVISKLFQEPCTEFYLLFNLFYDSNVPKLTENVSIFGRFFSCCGVYIVLTNVRMFVFKREPVHFVELFCNGQQFKNQCSVLRVFHFSFRASIPCNLSLDFSLLEAFVIAVCFSIFLKSKTKTKSVLLFTRANHTGENIPTEWQQDIIENL